MALAAHTIGIFTAHIQRVAVNRLIREGERVAQHSVLCHIVKVDAFNLSGCAKEKLIHKRFFQAKRVKNLRAAIGLIGGNAHF